MKYPSLYVILVMLPLKFNTIGPMHEEKILENTPKIPVASFSFSWLGVGVPLVKVNIFQRFKYR